MRSLSTELRCSVLQILSDTYGFNNLTDEDLAFVNVCGTYGDSRQGGGMRSTDMLKKALAEQTSRTAALGATGPDMKRADPPELRGPVGRTGPVGEPGIKGDPGGVGGPVGEVLPTLAPDDQAKLPLAPADRGPEPQDAGSLLSTTAPEIDPSDPPPDYTQLSTAATRSIDG
jgi:hypothetical protein